LLASEVRSSLERYTAFGRPRSLCVGDPPLEAPRRDEKKEHPEFPAVCKTLLLRGFFLIVFLGKLGFLDLEGKKCLKFPTV